MLRDLGVRRRLVVGDRVTDRTGTEYIVTTVGSKLAHLRLPESTKEVSMFMRDLTLVIAPPPPETPRKLTPDEEFLGAD